MKRFSWRGGFLAGLMVAAALVWPVSPAGAAAVDTAPTTESVRAMTWNICGEAGGHVPSPGNLDPGYCPDRNPPTAPLFLPGGPQVKADAIASVIAARNLNVVMLQEICGSATVPSGLSTPTQLDVLQSTLGSGWQFTWTKSVRAPVPDTDGTSPNPDARETSANCRGALSGTYGIALGVKGTLVRDDAAWLTAPDTNYEETKVLCGHIAGNSTEVCSTQLTGPDGGYPHYSEEVTTLLNTVGKYPKVVFGGDFNLQAGTANSPLLSPVYAKYAECDAQGYYQGDAANEPTHFTYAPTPTDPGHYNPSKLDYLFSTVGFTGCDSWTDKADQADYSTTTTPTGISDHAPLYGYTRGVPVQAWNLHDGSGSTAKDSAGTNNGTVQGVANWTTDRTGALALDGATSVTGPLGISTSQGFTVSAWVNVGAGAPTGAVVSQDGTTASKFILWYEADDNTWRFGMPTADSTGWSVDQVVPSAHVQLGAWTHVVGSYDYPSNTISLYADGVLLGTAQHTAQWSAGGPLAVGRDQYNGHSNAFFQGKVNDVQLFDYALTGNQVATLHNAQLAG